MYHMSYYWRDCLWFSLFFKSEAFWKIFHRVPSIGGGSNHVMSRMITFSKHRSITLVSKGKDNIYEKSCHNVVNVIIYITMPLKYPTKVYYVS